MLNLGKFARCGLFIGLAFGVPGCATDALKQTSASPDTAWSPDGTGAGDFSVPPNPEVARLPAGIQSGKPYGLPALIDLAQRSHPSTRIAWEQARQSALAVGMVEATFLPILTANVIGGRQDIVTPLPNLEGGTDYVSTTANGVAPNLALQWLIFDFGQRQAWRQAAQQNAYAANVNFNGTHQALIYNVTRSYYMYGAQKSSLAIAQQALANSRRIQDAAEARYANGTGTSIEVAQAKQLAAQSNLRLVQAQDGLRDAYQDLLGAVGISPRSRIEIASSANAPLPSPRALPTDALIKTALARRPDVLASYAGMKATEANVRAANADFLPKVYVSAVAGTNNTSLQTGNLPSIGGATTASGVLVGVSIPVYDGGIREARKRQAKSTTAAAAASFEQTRNAAMREIIVASDTLRSALESYAAAVALTDASQLTYDAAFDAYQNGIGTVTDATAAESGLLDARLARSDAHAASLIAASTLAFTLGAMTSSASPARATAP
ncbi:TolC family protein [Tropicimonas sp. IMCC34043]|uniref:TolC family protein n=1 Tax=Tropicimonas sp. IMCC34043 TaxID=2248760 RepID=UPI000E24A539|nr:TolC family protein [Tropicimonas sp. IMCC34043]